VEVLELLKRNAEVIDVAGGIWRSFATAWSSARALGRTNATLIVAGRRLHDAARPSEMSPEGLRILIDDIVKPLVQLGYLDEAITELLEDWANWSWTDEESTDIAAILRNQSYQLGLLAASEEPKHARCDPRRISG